VTIGGFVAGLLTLALAFLFGGWVAGRMARYDGGRNGLLVVVWFVVLAALLGAIGAWAGSDYDVFEGVHLPQWFSSNARTAGGLVTAAVGLLIMLIAAFVGGKVGERYHRRADALIVHTRTGGLLARARTIPATGRPQ